MTSLAELLGMPQAPQQMGTLQSIAMPPARMEPGFDPSFYRQSGERKGNGFLGNLKRPDGRISSELSIGVNIDGKEMEIPSMVPTLTPAEIQHLLSDGAMTHEIVRKATDHARMRMQQGKPVFAP